jgi:hypothetical protein
MRSREREREREREENPEAGQSEQSDGDRQD